MIRKIGYRTNADILVDDLPYFISYVEAEERFDRSYRVTAFTTANSALHLIMNNEKELEAKFPYHGESLDPEKEFALAFPKSTRAK